MKAGWGRSLTRHHLTIVTRMLPPAPSLLQPCHLQLWINTHHANISPRTILKLIPQSSVAESMAMDLSIHNSNKDNNNDIRVVDLSLAKPLSDDREEDGKNVTEDKLKSLLPQLDITALSILTLARLQVGNL